MSGNTFAHMFAQANGASPAQPTPTPTTAVAPVTQPAQQPAPTAQPATVAQPQPTFAAPQAPTAAQPAQQPAPAVGADQLLATLAAPAAQPQAQPQIIQVAAPQPAQPTQDPLREMFFGAPSTPQPAAQPVPTAQPAAQTQPVAQPAPTAQPAGESVPQFAIDPTTIQYGSIAEIDGLTPEVQQEYGSFLPHMDRIIRDRVATALKAAEKPISDAVGGLHQTVSSIPQQVQDTRRQTFMSTLAAAVPDFDTTLSNPQFQQYLNQPAPMRPGQTIMDMMRSANTQMDIQGVKAIVDSFKSQNTGVAQTPEQLYHTPHATAVAPATQTAGAKPMLSLRERSVLHQRMMAGDKQVQTAWPQIEAAYREAERENRLVA